MELVKKIVRVGNGAGVILPREWRGGEAKVELLRKPLDVRQDILELLKDYLPELEGIYLAGSYARGEEDELSDVDVLAVSSNKSERIISGKYTVVIVSLEGLKESIKSRTLPFYPMIQEAKPLINRSLLDELKSIGYSKKGIEKDIGEIESALDVIEGFVEEGLVSTSIVYTLVFRMRCAYLLKKILEARRYDNKGFVRLLRDNRLEDLYRIYRTEKSGKTSKNVAAEKVMKALELAKKILGEVKCLIGKK